MSAKYDDIIRGGVKCRMGLRNELLVNFFDFNPDRSPDLNEIAIKVTKFQNPWSAITIESIRISSYRSEDCSGDAESSKPMGAQTFYSLVIPETNAAITSTSTVLGDSDPANTVIFKVTPTYTTSRDGRGVISISLPQWYNVRGKLNMMYDERSVNKCTSPDMRINSSRPDLINRNLII